MGAAEWCGYSGAGPGSQYGSYPSLQPFSENTEHPTSLHLPTVLPQTTEYSSNHTQSGDYGNMSPRASAPTYSTLTELEPLITPRYPSDPNTPYSYTNSWSSNGYNAYNNYQYNNITPTSPLSCTQPQPPYINPPGPSMVLYPHLYSTVNQNQIHFHLHGSTDKLDQYFSGENALVTISSNPSVKGGIEIGIGMGGQTHSENEESNIQEQHVDSDGNQSQHSRNNPMGDLSSVWRPY